MTSTRATAWPSVAFLAPLLSETQANISLADISVNWTTTLKYVLKKQRGGRMDLSGT